MTSFNLKLRPCRRNGYRTLLFTALFILFGTTAMAQEVTVTGTVTDKSGQPVIGATVIEDGTTNGTATGMDGTYTLKIKGGGRFSAHSCIPITGIRRPDHSGKRTYPY